MLACAADEIICDRPRSSVRSAWSAARSASHELMEKLGIERRLYTSGERKAMLDPFLPEKPEDVKRLKAIQQEIHENFIALVKARRGAKLTGTDKKLFSGEFWTGATRHRARPGRSHRRSASASARALRRQGATCR